MRSMGFGNIDAATTRFEAHETLGYLPLEDCTGAATFAGPESLSPLFPVLLIAVVAASRVRRMNRHPYGRNRSTRIVGTDAPSDVIAWQFNNTEFCPLCCAEYLHGTERCEDCGVQLVEEEELPAAEMHVEEDVIRIASIRNPTHAHLLRGYFTSNRIPCSLARCTPCDVFGTDVYVFESDALRAKKLARHFLTDLELI